MAMSCGDVGVKFLLRGRLATAVELARRKILYPWTGYSGSLKILGLAERWEPLKGPLAWRACRQAQILMA